MKIGTTGSKYDIDRRCPKCGHENTFEINCEHVLSNVSHVEDSDTVVTFNDELEVNVRPYTLEMRQQFIQRQFEENQLLKAVDDQNKDMGDFDKARIVGESIEKITRMTFNLVSKSIESIKLLKQNITVTDPAEISEWLVNISKSQADMVIETVNKLNEVGVPRSVPAACEKCQHEWTETLTFDPVSFFGKR